MWLAINIFHKNLLFFCFVSIRVFPSQTIDYRNNCNFNMVNGDLWIVFIAFVGQFMDAILIEHSLINVNNFVWRVIGTSFSIERSHKIINSFCEKKWRFIVWIMVEYESWYYGIFIVFPFDDWFKEELNKKQMLKELWSNCRFT